MALKKKSKRKRGGLLEAQLFPAATVPRRVAMPMAREKQFSHGAGQEETETEDFSDLLPEPTSASLKDLQRRATAVTGVEETEQSRKFLELLNSAYHLAQDSALAVAQLERNIADTEVSSEHEVPDEFEADKTLATQRKLLELRVLADLAKSFGLELYLNQIMGTRIEALFGAKPVSFSTSPEGQTSFYGTDEAYLRYQTMAALKRGK